jgi:hypothetical protein
MIILLVIEKKKKHQNVKIYIMVFLYAQKYTLL